METVDREGEQPHPIVRLPIWATRAGTDGNKPRSKEQQQKVLINR